MKRLSEDLNLLAQEDPESPATKQAATLGLKYVGFGRYEDPKTQQITHIVQNDKLVPFNRAVRSNTFQTKNADDIGNYTQAISPDLENLHNTLTAHYSPEKYDDRQLDAIYTYTNGGYVDINQRLSALPSGVPANKIERTSAQDTIIDVISSLDSALKKSRAPLDFHTYTNLGSDVNLNSLQPGTTQFRFKSYRDTSINMQNVINSVQNNATSQSGRPMTVLLQIKVRKNSRGMYIADFSQNSEDNEFLLQRGATLQVVSGPNKLVGSNAMSETMNMEIVYYDCVLKS
jgi:hypothetical protein